MNGVGIRLRAPDMRAIRNRPDVPVPDSRAAPSLHKILTGRAKPVHSIIRWNDGSMAKKREVSEHRHPARAFPKLPAGSRLDGASDMFRALGDPSRLRLLARLAAAEGEVCVTELAELENEKLSTISARLQTLHAVRLVKRRRAAKHIFYALTDLHVLHLMQSAIDHAAERQ